MRVAMLIWSYWPGAEGGAERQCRKILENAEKHSVEFVVLTSRFSFCVAARERANKGKIVRLGLFVPLENKLRRHFQYLFNNMPLRRFAGERIDQKLEAVLFWLMLPLVWFSRGVFILTLWKWIAENSDTVDVLHVHEAGWLAGVGGWLGKRYGIPVLAKTATAVALPGIGFDTPLRKLWLRSRTECHFIAQHEELARQLLANGIFKNRIFLLANGVEIPPKAAQPHQLDGIVLYVGNFSQGANWKAFDILIIAWSKVILRRPSARLNMLGGGESRQWKNLADSLGCEGTIHFLGRFNDSAPFYQGASLFVLPSRVEGISNALLEAMSYGLPCVVSDIPGNRLLVQDNVTGVVVPVNDPEALAEGILRLLEKPELRQKLGEEAREKVSNQHSIEQNVHALIENYNKILMPVKE